MTRINNLHLPNEPFLSSVTNNTRSICSASYAGHLATRLSRFGTSSHDANGPLKVKEREFNSDPDLVLDLASTVGDTYALSCTPPRRQQQRFVIAIGSTTI